MAEVVFPPALMFTGLSWRFARTQALGPETLSGLRRVSGAPGGVWTAQAGVNVTGVSQVRNFRLLMSRLDGMSNHVALPVCDPYSINHAATAAPLAAAPAKSTLLRVASAAFGGAAHQPGQFISVDGFLHEIVAVDTGTPGENRLTIRPELRKPITLSSVVSTKATCRMRLISADQGQVFLTLGRSGSASLSFIEAYETWL